MRDDELPELGRLFPRAAPRALARQAPPLERREHQAADGDPRELVDAGSHPTSTPAAAAALSHDDNRLVLALCDAAERLADRIVMAAACGSIAPAELELSGEYAAELLTLIDAARGE